jgi:hypothetical protein
MTEERKPHVSDWRGIGPPPSFKDVTATSDVAQLAVPDAAAAGRVLAANVAALPVPLILTTPTQQIAQMAPQCTGSVVLKPDDLRRFATTHVSGFQAGSQLGPDFLRANPVEARGLLRDVLKLTTPPPGKLLTVVWLAGMGAALVVKYAAKHTGNDPVARLGNVALDVGGVVSCLAHPDVLSTVLAAGSAVGDIIGVARPELEPKLQGILNASELIDSIVNNRIGVEAAIFAASQSLAPMTIAQAPEPPRRG